MRHKCALVVLVEDCPKPRVCEVARHESERASEQEHTATRRARIDKVTASSRCFLSCFCFDTQDSQRSGGDALEALQRARIGLLERVKIDCTRQAAVRTFSHRLEYGPSDRKPTADDVEKALQTRL